MYNRQIESDKTEMQMHNTNMKFAAAVRRVGMKHLPRPAASPNRKSHAALQSRRQDWSVMTSAVSWKAPEGSFHRPGSNNK